MLRSCNCVRASSSPRIVRKGNQRPETRHRYEHVFLLHSATRFDVSCTSEKHIVQSLQVQHAVHLHQLAAWQTLQDEFRDKLKEILEAAMSDVDEAQKEHADQQE